MPLTPRLSGARRKLLYATLYELLAIAMLTALAAAWPSVDTGAALGLAVTTSVIAWLWNLAFNTAFEAWEARQPQGGRPWRHRLLHALGFEVGLALFTVPLIAAWLKLSWLAALWADLGLIVLFLVYTAAFNWGFDRVFGLPASARR